MLLFAAAVLVGSQACRTCHTAIFDAYARTPMAQSSGKAESLSPAEFRASGFHYRIAGRRLFFDGGSLPVDYFIGSNSAGRSYLRGYNGYLYELPVTWYAQKQKWDSSPGYDANSEFRLTRAVEPTCLLCHASRVRPVYGTQNRFGDPPFLENGVSCERCHGPGSEHLVNPARSPMINPARLDVERRDAICNQCHLTGESRVERPGRRFAEFQPGDRLADYATYFVWKSGGEFKVTSHAERLAASACKRASGGDLWCGTCHEPHTGANNTQKACTGCHADSHHQQEQCVSCHMPKLKVADAAHAVMTDHRIPRLANLNPSAAGPSDLAPFLGTADDRAIGLAYAERGDPRAHDYLARAVPQDWPVLLRRAVLEANPSRAAAFYESVLQANPTEPAALVNLGAIYAQAGRTADAARLWKKALEANPALEPPILNLSQILPKEESLALLKQYLELNPVSPKANARLAALESSGR